MFAKNLATIPDCEPELNPVMGWTLEALVTGDTRPEFNELHKAIPDSVASQAQGDGETAAEC